MVIDVQDRLLDELDGLNTGMRTVVGINDLTDSIALIYTGGGGIVREFFDGRIERQFPLSLHVKSSNQLLALNTCLRITRHFNELNVLNSHNGSYEFLGSTVEESPILLSITEQNEHIYGVTIQIKIETKKEFDINGKI